MVVLVPLRPVLRVPPQLKTYGTRFFLAGASIERAKLPSEPKWNTVNNYHFFDEKFLCHQGNYGIVCGTLSDGLIVLDFDNEPFYDTVKYKLPPTFTVLSATRRLPHLYYFLQGEMMRKTALQKDGKTLVDIQADRCGIIGPGSAVDRRYYAVDKDIPIAPITKDLLVKVLGIVPRAPVVYDGELREDVVAVRQTMGALLDLGIEYRTGRMFKCPFHEMRGNGNLNVMPNGFIYCFHEIKCWHTFIDFKTQYQTWVKNGNHN